MSINTTQSIADTLGISTERVRQIAKQLNLTPQMIGKAMTFSDAQKRRIEKAKNDAQVGRPRKKGGKK